MHAAGHPRDIGMKRRCRRLYALCHDFSSSLFSAREEYYSTSGAARTLLGVLRISPVRSYTACTAQLVGGGSGLEEQAMKEQPPADAGLLAITALITFLAALGVSGGTNIW